MVKDKIDHLCEENLNSYFREGYLRMPNLIPPPLLEKLRAFFDELMFEDTMKELKKINQKSVHVKPSAYCFENLF